ncbi:MAG: formate dehydrogenase accessory sulfurtransferase FdhD [Desulfobacterales bacterium]|nr:formate dehydrogenase accessory sulfurtransferase FdhD [Desulfobacterales bacterium]
MIPVNSADKPKETKNYREEQITVYEDGREKSVKEAIILEKPLSIVIDGNPYSLVMCSPGDEEALIAGFCLSEGVIEHLDDLLSVDFSAAAGVNTATVTLSPGRRQKTGDMCNKKQTGIPTGCGICKDQPAGATCRPLTPVISHHQFTIEEVLGCIHRLPKYQVLHPKTHSAHAAMIFDQALAPISFAEDVGRHNALDKAIGRVVLDDKMPSVVLGVMSSRLSYELVQKAARAKIKMLFGISRPTALAVDLARSVDMTLGCTKHDKLMIFCGGNRIVP